MNAAAPLPYFRPLLAFRPAVPAAAHPAPGPEPLKDGFAATAAAKLRAAAAARPPETPWVKVVVGDALTISVKPGQTLWGLSRTWARGPWDPPGLGRPIGEVVDALKRENGLTSNLIRPGQVLQVPYAEAGSLTLALAIAIQKDQALRKKDGRPPFAVAFTAIDVQGGPSGAYVVTLPRRDGKGEQKLLVTEDQEGEGERGYRVHRLEDTSFANHY